MDRRAAETEHLARLPHIYQQYQAGFYGLATAGNVVLFLMVMLLVAQLQWLLARGGYTK